MRHINEMDVQRTRGVLRELQARQAELGAQLDREGLDDFDDRIEWLTGQRTADEALAWDRRWPEQIRGMSERDDEPSMSSTELLDEIQWMLGNGATPWEVGAALGRRPDTMARMAYRYGRFELAASLNAERWAS